MSLYFTSGVVSALLGKVEFEIGMLFVCFSIAVAANTFYVLHVSIPPVPPFNYSHLLCSAF